MLSNTFPIVALAAFVLLASTPATLAQDINGLPPCASKCLASALASGGKSCAQTDFACLCKNSEFVAASDKCYNSSCTTNDLAAAQKWSVSVSLCCSRRPARHGRSHSRCQWRRKRRQRPRECRQQHRQQLGR
ncbi:hypothetical protein VP01_1454g4 [Puccinia sorghi]|uniref:CFEM domain-containing protein n=1 Tax=Puccinia sorghi TaxID=27349 RepID=A0A0L6VK52_9BASI|nr:hypothetical protein VP01_1454g4 [Puccinia sorghi]